MLKEVGGGMLDERKMMVLQAIIDDYIHSAEPVGSRTIARRYKLGVSPATIRNEMADLEETGYIVQPHISAGRIPSDKGYRFYVDMLMKPQEISKEERKQMQHKEMNRQQQTDQVIQETCKLLALFTQYIAVVVAPPVNACVLKHIQLVPIDDTNILVVMVLNPGMVQNRIIRTNIGYSAGELSHISEQLNQRLRGITYREIGSTLIKDIRDNFGDIGIALLEIIAGELGESGHEQMYLNGAIQIFNQPEFKDINRVRPLLSILEEKQIVSSVLNDLAKVTGVQVAIGHENNRVEIQECSVVTSTYSVGGEVIGAIGVIGPTRMEYAKVFSAVDLLANSLSEILSELVK